MNKKYLSSCFHDLLDRWDDRIFFLSKRRHREVSAYVRTATVILKEGGGECRGGRLSVCGCGMSSVDGP